MSHSKKKRTSVKVPMRIASDLDEVGRLLEDASGQKIGGRKTAALTMLVEQFVDDHRGSFLKKNPVEEGDEPHFVFTGGGQVDVDSEKWGSSEKDDNTTDTDGHFSFSMKDGPSQDS